MAHTILGTLALLGLLGHATVAEGFGPTATVCTNHSDLTVYPTDDGRCDTPVRRAVWPASLSLTVHTFVHLLYVGRAILNFPSLP